MRNINCAILLALFGQIHYACGLSGTNPVIDTKVGPIRGLRATDGDYSMFLGIPYAVVNKTNPFGVSLPQPKFQEVFDAYNDSAICPQVEEFNNTIVGSLDCLHINVYVPNTVSPNNPLPVLLYIYGGLYKIGFAGRYVYGPRFLMKQNIILVTFNYRLGPYGFMCLGTSDVPGNQGLKDQKLALKWVKENIEAFGGNSSQITLCGSSSGASAADFHLMYSHERLFDQVIMQSGTALYPWSMLKPDAMAPLKLSKHLGSATTNIDEAMAFLSTVSPSLLIAATSELGLAFRPCVENDTNNGEKFIYDYPVNIKKPNLARFGVTAEGACHADELGYLFDVSYMDKNITSDDKLIIDRLSTLWANFVKFGASDGDYSMFMGIPYATVDKSNPFGPSTPHPAFDHIFEAYDDSAICPQIEEFNNTVVGTLDCLHVNIYAPNSANSRNRLPVAVWIYGGGFSIGFSGRYLYGPSYIVKQDIILVTLNYRLGPYGFMSLNTADMPGNQGLKDQRLALKWIKENIEAFGGDSDKITIFGESAGGASVDLQFLYNQEKLFDKVIMQSGTAICPWVVIEPDTSAPLKLSEHLGFKTTNAEEALAFLATVDTSLLIAATSELGLMFRPSVEKGFDSDDKFIYDYPINVKKTNLRNVPILIGYNSDERLTTYETLSSADFAKLDLFKDHLNYFDLDDENLVEMEALLRHFYIGDEEISEYVKNELIKFDSDFWFNHPVQRTIQKYLDSGARHIYKYVFSYDGKRNFVKDRLNVTAAGAAHADEIGYFFDISYMAPPSWEDQIIIDRVTTLWANFVKFGNPTPVSTELLPVQWPPVTKESLNYLNINLDLKVEKRHYKSRMAFWDLFYKLNGNAQIGYEESSK
ncbi:unnamed protein product [Spodoptera exigua]|nr:unnamed protein product [Spodoptera exigua]